MPYLGVDRLAPRCLGSGFSASRPRLAVAARGACSPASASAPVSSSSALQGRRDRHQPALLRRLRRPQRPATPARRPKRCCGWASRFGRWASRWSVTDRSGRVTAAANLPFEAPLDDPRVLAYAAKLDRQNPPIVDEAIGTVHYGPLPGPAQSDRARRAAGAHHRGDGRRWRSSPIGARWRPSAIASGWRWPARRRIRWARRSPVCRDGSSGCAPGRRRRRTWPITSRPMRSGSIGWRGGSSVSAIPAKREPIGLGALADRVAGYYRPRLPRRANPIELRLEAPGAGPTVLGDPVLLEWALESMVKNAIDALQGRSGTIILRVGAEEGMGGSAGDRRRAGRPQGDSSHPVRARHHDQTRRMGHRPRALPPGRGGCPRRCAGAGAHGKGSLFPDAHSPGRRRSDDRYAPRPSCRSPSIRPSGRRWSTSTDRCWCSPARGRARRACSPRGSRR